MYICIYVYVYVCSDLKCMNICSICKKCEDCFVLIYTYSGVVRDEDLNSSYGTLDLGESFQSESESVYVCTVCMYMYMRVCMYVLVSPHMTKERAIRYCTYFFHC